MELLGLFSDTYLEWYKRLGHNIGSVVPSGVRLRSLTDAVAAPPDHGGGAPHLLALLQGGDGHGDYGVHPVGAIVPAEVPANAAGPAPLSVDEDPVSKQRREQAAFRGTGKSWCESGQVLGDCASILLGVRLARTLMRNCLKISTVGYEKEQRRIETRARENARSLAQEEPVRKKCRLQAAYDAEGTMSLIEESHQTMFDDNAYTAVPRRSRTHARKTMCFKQLSRLSVRAHKNKTDLENYPCKAFGSLHLPHLRWEIDADAACRRRMDPWSRAVHTFHKSATTVGHQMHPRAASVKCRHESVEIERNHAFLNKFVVGWCASSRVIDIDSMNDYWLDAMAKKQTKGPWGERIPAELEHPSECDVETEVTESTRAVCGWNVFSGIRKRNGEVWKRGAGADWKNMSEEEQKWFHDKAVQVELATNHENA